MTTANGFRIGDRVVARKRTGRQEARWVGDYVGTEGPSRVRVRDAEDRVGVFPVGDVALDRELGHGGPSLAEVFDQAVAPVRAAVEQLVEAFTPEPRQADYALAPAPAVKLGLPVKVSAERAADFPLAVQGEVDVEQLCKCGDALKRHSKRPNEPARCLKRSCGCLRFRPRVTA